MKIELKVADGHLVVCVITDASIAEGRIPLADLRDAMEQAAWANWPARGTKDAKPSAQ